MGLETATYIDGLNATNPTGTDAKSQGDDHLRLLKTVLKNTFPNINRDFRISNTLGAQTSNYGATASTFENLVVPVNAASGNLTVTLPAVPARDGLEAVIIKLDATANTVTLQGNGNNINGAASLVLRYQYQFARVIWCATIGAWFAEVSMKTGPDAVQLATLAGTETLTNKTLTNPVINSPLINTPTISGGQITGITDLALADGGTGASLSAPAADRLMFYDFSAGGVRFLTPSTNLTISDATITADGYPIARTAQTNISVSTVAPKTGIPDWVNRVTVMFEFVSTVGTSEPIIQLGYPSTYAASGYYCFARNSAGTVRTSTAGFLLCANNSAALFHSGVATLHRLIDNRWACEVQSNDGTNFSWSWGTIDLPGVLDKLRFANDPSESFDGGLFNTYWE